MTWQPAYERRVIKARRFCEDARDQLTSLGAIERREPEVADAIAQLKHIEWALAVLWERTYGPDRT